MVHINRAAMEQQFLTVLTLWHPLGFWNFQKK